MTRFFNTAGPCKPDIHFVVSPMRRLPEVRALIDRQGYFALHAPRQAGKTTALLALSAELTAEGRYAAVVVTAETGAPFGDDPGAAEGAFLSTFRDRARAQLPPELQPPPWPTSEPGSRVGAALTAWAEACPRPVVLFIDEIDAGTAWVAGVRRRRIAPTTATSRGLGAGLEEIQERAMTAPNGDIISALRKGSCHA